VAIPRPAEHSGMVGRRDHPRRGRLPGASPTAENPVVELERARLPLFNPRAVSQVVQFDDRHFCLVIDDALLDPDQVRQFAVDRRHEFTAVNFSYYPGVYLMAPEDWTAQLAAQFWLQARRRFDARRCLNTIGRYSLATKPPHELHPLQWLCHRDDVGLEPQLSMQASVLYLFRDPELGGTGFYVPTRSAADTGTLFADARLMEPAAFAEKHALSPAYQCQSNAWFQRIGGIEAKWNRLIVYDGGLFHASDITAPDRLSPDPRVGRLTLNGFFTCRRHAA
jgi:hypothetical protein